jgi:hypothetical protein
MSAGVSLAWALALGFGSLSSALALVDRTAIARISLVLDRPGLAWIQALGGYALIAMASRQLPSTPQGLSTPSKIGWLALLAWTYRLLLLRFLWLTGNALPSQRLEVEVAALSTSLGNLPLYAFFAVLADALLFAHAAICLTDSTRAKGWLSTSANQDLGKASLIATGLILYVVGTIATVCLATGRV